MCKKIGAIDPLCQDELRVKCLEGKNDKECAEAVASHFAAVSNEYEPVDLSALPAFLPALPPPQVEEYMVYEKMKIMKNTKGTLPLDIPSKLRKEVTVELVTPLTHIINTALATGQYPALWKKEYVTPVPKVKEPETMKDVRKIACTSDFNKLFEGFLKDIMIEDVLPNLDPKQYGGRKKIGTDHMVVALMDRVLSLLDNYNTKSAVIMAAADWMSAFERGDPTKTTLKLISLKLRPSIVPLIISYMSGRTMTLKYNQEESSLYQLCGGYPQGSKIGQDCYLGSSDDAAHHINQEDRFRYIDDLQILELIMLTGILSDYNIYMHVASDIPLDHKFLDGGYTNMQSHLDRLSQWSDSNLTKLNPAKCSYMILSRAKEDFVTRLSVGGTKIDQRAATKILGCWIDEDVGKWSTNTKELIKSAYSRISMLTKLKYTGLNTQDLVEIYSLFIRSRAEYMSVVWNSSLTVAEVKKIENIQKTSLKIILGETYTDYQSSLERTGLTELSARRQARCLSFSKKCTQTPLMKDMFPINPEHMNGVRRSEKYHVNFAHTESYRQSTVPYCQRLLNQHELMEEERRRTRREEARTREREEGASTGGEEGF